MVKEEIVSIASALVGGARYGAKVRLPHALVMTFLFRRDLSLRDKLKSIASLVFQHASSLAAFAAIYKTILTLLKMAHRSLVALDPVPNAGQRYWNAVGRSLVTRIVDGPLPGENRLLRVTNAPPGHPERIHHAFIAGAVGGYYVWGRYNSLNQQILLYLVSRVILGVWNRICQQRSDRRLPSAPRANQTNSRTFSWIAALTWAVVMALWEESPDALHPSLKKSMDEIYRHVLAQPKLIFDEVEPPLASLTVKD